jgi:hypothetical protein
LRDRSGLAKRMVDEGMTTIRECLHIRAMATVYELKTPTLMKEV